MADGKGGATVESERGVICVSAGFENFVQPSTFGPEYLTVRPVGPSRRMAGRSIWRELTLDHYGKGSSSAIKTTSEIQTFGMRS